jgi:O-antigen ligase
MNSGALTWTRPGDLGSALAAAFLRAFYALIAAPDYLLLIALTAMLFCPPDLPGFPVDRVAFTLLLAVASIRVFLRCDQYHIHSATWPMLALLSLGLYGVLAQPYDAKAWSVLAAQWIVPAAMFHLGGTIFSTPDSQRKLEWFSVAVLLYLSLVAVFWLANLHSFIIPRFILDESIGIHFDRARGPLLQAVANGVCLNLLAIVALHALDRRSLRVLHASRIPMGVVLTATLLVITPLALFATRTRAVWLTTVLSAALIIFFGRGRRSRLVVAALVPIAAVVVAFTWLLQTRHEKLADRLQERSPVEFRLEMYRAGWQMFIEKPLLGWGSNVSIQPEIERRISGFHPEYYIFHNTYLQLAVQHGVVGLLLYFWLFIVLFRLGARENFSQAARACAFGPDFGLMWRIMLCVYLLNASVVVMNYQFLNGYMFTIAGILAAQQKSRSREAGG